MADGKEMEDYDSPEWKGGKSNIICAVRVRPVSENERKKREEEVVSVFNQTNIVVKDPGHMATNQMRQKRLRERKYAFDSAFAPGVGTDVVYKATVRHLIDGVLQGYNATCFAYGATGSGKTFTMLGTPNSPGMFLGFCMRRLWGCSVLCILAALVIPQGWHSSMTLHWHASPWPCAGPPALACVCVVPTTVSPLSLACRCHGAYPC